MAENELTTAQKVSLKKRQLFLDTLAQTGRVITAATAAGFTDTSYLHRLRREDEDFARQWNEAIEAAADVLEEEATRRAVDGVLEPVFYKGDVVGYKTNYSDQLMMFLLRGLRPDKFNPKQGDTNVNVKFGVAVLPMTAPNADDWEKNAIEVHANQQKISLEDKPTEDNSRFQTVTRSD